MSRSLNEVSALARKAVRGAGYSWGMAEEAGWAVWWLCRQGVDGVGLLAALLREHAALGAPVLHGNDWRLPTGALCPLFAGTALADRAVEIAGQERSLNQIACPALVVPFLSNVAQQRALHVTVKTPVGEALIADGSAQFVGHWNGQAAPVQVTWAEVSVQPMSPHLRARPADEDWPLLEWFAAKTYAPATEASRQRGEGADGDGSKA